MLHPDSARSSARQTSFKFGNGSELSPNQGSRFGQYSFKKAQDLSSPNKSPNLSPLRAIGIMKRAKERRRKRKGKEKTEQVLCNVSQQIFED